MTYFCGFDGGGTATKVCVTDENGIVTGEATFGPLNPNGAPLAAVTAAVNDCLAYLDARPGGLAACRGLAAGLAGASSATAAAVLERGARKQGFTGGIFITGDCDIALAGAIEGPGAVLISGTGSVCCGRDAEGSTFRCGGFGYLIDDAGSAWAIGRALLSAAARSLDGRGPSTVLTEAVLTETGADTREKLISWIYAPAADKAKVAALAPLLIPALGQNDALALAIEKQTAADLSDLAVAAWRKGGLDAGELALAGGVLTHFDGVRALTTAILRRELPRARIIAPRHSAAFGAAELAREKFG
ncbi:MAG: ATPase [Clostridia bacterium]|nr:ATPase [Clostridia bacterium]